MSWVTHFARLVGLGGVVDAIEAAEKGPSPETIGGVVAAATQINPSVVTAVAISDLGTAAGNVVAQDVAKTLGADAATVEASVAAPILHDVEQAALAALAKATGGIL